jgi:hypothetical protein
MEREQRRIPDVRRDSAAFERAACARYETQKPAASDGGGSETAAHTPRRTSRSARP